MTTAVLEETILDQKRVTISSKRQFTIPQKFFQKIGFGKEAECILTSDGILIRPISQNQGSELAEAILKDLIDQGLSGEELLAAFKKQQAKVAPAVHSMLKEAKKVAKGKAPYETMDDVFAAED
ncbi:AbrB/MazE/SpoVT family DNA-binding domain-containing protein [Acidaminococcus sp.]|uniref:AbrB/MazE/SpoVT family DNA-binding domain-containing protein n=1 Tax=Acidaminococcus sp. TaxID=1872103 RepID=UPI003D7DAE6C